MKAATEKCYGDVNNAWTGCYGALCPICKGKGKYLTPKGEQIKEVLVFFGLVKEKEEQG